MQKTITLPKLFVAVVVRTLLDSAEDTEEGREGREEAIILVLHISWAASCSALITESVLMLGIPKIHGFHPLSDVASPPPDFNPQSSLPDGSGHSCFLISTSISATLGICVEIEPTPSFLCHRPRPPIVFHLRRPTSNQ